MHASPATAKAATATHATPATAAETTAGEGLVNDEQETGRNYDCTDHTTPPLID
jgi:hypothetical protein